MEIVSKIIIEVLIFLLTGLVFVGTYSFGKFLTTQFSGPKWFNYFRAIGVTLTLAIIVASNYGYHTDDQDPLYGGGEVIEDFAVSSEQRIYYGIEIFLMLTIPTFCGVYKGKTKEQADIYKKTELRKVFLLVEDELKDKKVVKAKK